jgi:hypothetical protein
MNSTTDTAETSSPTTADTTHGNNAPSLPNPAIGIVAHISRQRWADELADQIKATHVSMDNGTLGTYGNHLATWQYHQYNTDSDWAVVIEDDALPISDFRHQLGMALAAAPTDIVSLYLGRSRPPQHQPAIATAIASATALNHAWLTAPKLIHAVGVAIRTEHVADLCRTLQRTRGIDIDEAISEWAHMRHLTIGYTLPSLVDHRDGPTITKHRDQADRPAGRTAWTVGSRQHWNNHTTAIPL